MKCAYHQDREATDYCASCKTPLCSQCAASAKDRSPLCSRCVALGAANDAAQGIEQRLAEKGRRAEGHLVKEEKRKRLWFLLKWALIIISLAVFIIQTPRIMSLFKEEKHFRQGIIETDSPTDVCIGNLYRIVSLSQQGKSSQPAIHCPASGKGYIITIEDKKVVVRCPDPKRHGLKELRASTDNPIPELIK